jgi:hypothetical protein
MPVGLVLIWRFVLSQLQYVMREHGAAFVTDAQKTVLFCLAFQPEESTAPRAGQYADQCLAITEIARRIPADWRVYVREHPDQARRRYPRELSYFRRIRAIPTVTIASLRQDAQQAMERSNIVATCGGSMAIRAWQMGKPVILFSHMAIKRAPGVFFIDGESALSAALHDASKLRGALPNEISAFAHYLDHCALEGDIGYRSYKRRSDRAVAEASLVDVIGSHIDT